MAGMSGGTDAGSGVLPASQLRFTNLRRRDGQEPITHPGLDTRLAHTLHTHPSAHARRTPYVHPMHTCTRLNPNTHHMHTHPRTHTLRTHTLTRTDKHSTHTQAHTCLPRPVLV
eukprot:2017991-Rhodomonas_salina.1